MSKKILALEKTHGYKHIISGITNSGICNTNRLGY